jgi:hypothetical protein
MQLLIQFCRPCIQNIVITFVSFKNLLKAVIDVKVCTKLTILINIKLNFYLINL